MIATCTEYERLERAIAEHREVLTDAADAEYEACMVPVRLWYEEEKSKANTIAKLQLVEKEYKKRSAPCADPHTAATSAAFAEQNAAIAALRREARPTLAWLEEAIITTPSLEQEAQQIKLFFPTDDPPILVVRSFDDLRQLLEQDRCWMLLHLLLEAEGGFIRFGTEGHTLTELAALWKPTVKMRVPETLFFEGRSVGTPPADSLAFKELLGSAGVEDKWTLGPPAEDHLTTLCVPPGVLGGPIGYLLWSAVSEHYIQKDFVMKQNPQPQDVYYDDGWAGPIDLRYVQFLSDKNPGLSAVLQGFLLTTSVRRPDIILDDGVRKELEEIKPDSLPGRADGRLKLRQIDFYMWVLGLPYVRGHTYIPTTTIPLISKKYLGIPVDLSLTVRRLIPGLIVYRICIRTDWAKVVLGAALIAWIIAVIRELLKERGIPVPQPA